MLLVLVLGVGASFAADTNQTGMQASDDTDAAVSISETDTVSSNDNDTVISVNEDSGETLRETTGTFTELSQLINESGGNLKLQKSYVYNSATDSAFKNGIPINKDIDITINGLTNTIDGNGEARIFDVISGNVKLMDITFKNSVSTSSKGAVYWSGSNGELLRCTFTNNTDTNYGALYWTGTSGIISGCAFKNNHATNYGAVGLNVDEIKMTGCTFENNYATTNYGALGVLKAYIEISSCIFIGNHATNNGGAVYWSGAQGNLVDSQFKENYAKNYGAFYVPGTYLTVSYCNFNNNYANNTGAGYFSGECVNIYNSTFKNNKATGDIGALYFNSDQGCMFDSNFTNNSATGHSGSIYSTTTIGNIERCQFEDNNATTNGGAIYLTNNNPQIVGCYFRNNRAANGGATYTACSISNSIFENNVATTGGAIFSNSRGIFGNCVFKNNVATTGGALTLNGNNAYIRNSSFEYNQASNQGGAINVLKPYAAVLNSTFVGNSANNLGGAIYNIENYFSEINCKFNENTAQYNSGAMYISPNKKVSIDYTNSNYVNASGITNMPSELTVTSTDSGAGSSSEITLIYALNNIANGGTIILNSGTYIINSALSTYSKSVNIIGNGAVTLNYNQANVAGLCLQGISSSVNNIKFINALSSQRIIRSDTSAQFCIITNCTFDNVGSLVIGGRYWTISDSYFRNNEVVAITAEYLAQSIINCTFENNDVGTGNGAAIRVYRSSWTIENCTFISNSAGYGGAIYNPGYDLTVIHCKFYNNTAKTQGGAIFSNAQSTTVIDCTFSENSALTGGAIYCTGNVLSITNSNFTENNATNGGAVYTTGRSTSVENSNFTNNSASTGGALYNTGYLLSISSSDFDNNEASDNGGALYNTGGGASVASSDFTGNSASNGGAIYSNGADTSVKGSDFSKNNASNGGAFYSDGDDASVTGSSFDGNDASTGSAIMVGTGSNINIETSDFGGDTGSGGIIYSEEGSDITIDTSTTNIDESEIKGSGHVTKTEKILYVDRVTGGTGDGTSESNPTDLQSALNSIDNEGEIRLLSGTYDLGTFGVITFSKTFNLTGWQSNVKITNGGAGQLLDITSDNVAIKNIEFENIDGDYIVIGGRNILIESCKFIGGNTDSHNYALISTSSLSSGFTVRKSNFTGLKYHNVLSIDSDEATIDSCIFISNSVATAVANDYIIDLEGSNAYIQNTNFTSNTAKSIKLGVQQSNNRIINVEFRNNNVGTASKNALIEVNSVSSTVDGAVFSGNTANNLIYWTATANGGTINNADFTATNTGGTYKNIYSGVNDLTLTNNKFIVSSASFNTINTVNYPNDVTISGTFNIGSNVITGVPIYADGSLITSLNLYNSNSFSYVWSGKLPDTYTLTFGSTDGNGNTYTYSTTPSSKTATVNRLSTVYISPEGTGTGASESDPTNWDNVANVLANTGSVVFTAGNYKLNGKTISQSWKLSNSGTVIIDAENNGRIFTINANNVEITGITFKNGKVSGNQGSAISWTGTGGKISNSIFTENTGVPISSANDLTITNTQMKNQISLTKSNINWGVKETVKATFPHSAPSTVTVLFNDASQGSFSVSSKVATAEINFVNPSTQAVGSYVVTDLKNNHKEVL